MVVNPGKCHYLIINKDINESIELDEKILPLGIIIDKDLNF